MCFGSFLYVRTRAEVVNKVVYAVLKSSERTNGFQRKRRTEMRGVWCFMVLTRVRSCVGRRRRGRVE